MAFSTLFFVQYYKYENNGQNYWGVLFQILTVLYNERLTRTQNDMSQNFSGFTHLLIPIPPYLRAFLLGFLTHLRIPSFAKRKVPLHLALFSSSIRGFFYILHGKGNKELRKMSVSLTVMTFNLLEDQVEGSPNSWDKRKDLCVTVITSYSPMILCTQQGSCLISLSEN